LRPLSQHSNHNGLNHIRWDAVTDAQPCPIAKLHREYPPPTGTATATAAHDDLDETLPHDDLQGVHLRRRS
jgi:hypothetical protein